MMEDVRRDNQALKRINLQLMAAGRGGGGAGERGGGCTHLALSSCSWWTRCWVACAKSPY